MTPAGTCARCERRDEQPARGHRRLLCHAVALGALGSTPARADDRGPGWAVGLDDTTGYGGHVAELHFGLRLELGGFVRVGRLQATVSVPYTFATSDAAARDGHRLDDLGLAARVAYRLPIAEHAALSAALGLERQWLWGNEVVTRECRITNTCLAGFYMETASYRAWAPELRIGIGLEQLRPNMVIGAAFDVIVLAVRVDVPGRELSGITVLGGVSVTIGGGPARPSAYR